jgi:hypothetical protein
MIKRFSMIGGMLYAMATFAASNVEKLASAYLPLISLATRQEHLRVTANDLTVDARSTGAQPQERPILFIRRVTADLREATLRNGPFRSKVWARTIADCPPYPASTTAPGTR